MLELFKFACSGFWVFVGCTILICIFTDAAVTSIRHLIYLFCKIITFIKKTDEKI